MIRTIKKLFGIAPQEEADGSYSPSKLSLKLATVQKTDYEPVDYVPYQGSRSTIVVLFTERKDMTMKNGKRFNTGNHPVEALVPLLHLRQAGFDFEFVTQTGQPVVFEEWAFPVQDDRVKSIYQDFKLRFEHPKALPEFLKAARDQADAYAAVFVPGGHGAMLGIPEDENVGQLLRWAHEHDLYTISICHGPGSFLATRLNGQDFLYKGYNMAVFPDSVDQMTPKIGYLPGPMPRRLSEPLKDLGANLVNSKSDDTVCLDRRLITGASPLASHKLGKLAAETLLKALT